MDNSTALPLYDSKRKLMQIFGPGILLAAAAIGGSHLVASTRAGAEYGWSLLGVILLVNLFKYPFFEFSHRYTVATGESLLDGYRRLGRGYLHLYFLLSLITGTVNIAGLVLITASLASMFFGWNVPLWWLSLGVGAGSALLIILGRYQLLDSVIKVVVVTLTVATLVAAFVAVGSGPVASADYEGPSPWTLASFGFVIILMGWMPAPIDVSAWQSLWMLSKEKETGYRPNLREALIDFNVGYIATAVLAVVFLALGALVMHGSGVELSASGPVFAHQLVQMYTETIGNWVYWVIVTAAFATILSSTLTCIDAYPRSMAVSTQLLHAPWKDRERQLHVVWIIAITAAALVIVFGFKNNLLSMLDFAMVLAFLATPVFAFLNLRVMTAEWVPESFRPGRRMLALAWVGLIYLTVFCLLFLIWYFQQ